MQQNTILPYLVFIKPNFPWNQLLTMDSMLNWRASGILRNIFLYILEEIRFNRPLSFSSFWTLQVKLSKCGLVFPAQEGLKIRGCQLWFGGHNLPTLVEIGLTDLPKSGGGAWQPGTTRDNKPGFKYSDLPNNRAANLIIFREEKRLHNLIRTYTFINFWEYPFKTWFSPT